MVGPLLLLLTPVLLSFACGRTAQPTIPGDTMDGEGAAPASPSSAQGGQAPLPSDEAACVAFCEGRQIHIQHCQATDGVVALSESYEECIHSATKADFGLCPTGPSCGGWLSGCLNDWVARNMSGVDDGFPPG